MTHYHRPKTNTLELEIITRRSLLAKIDTMDCYGNSIRGANDLRDNTTRDKALIAFLYLSAARISEVVRRVRRSDLEIKQDEYGKYLVINNMLCLKRQDTKNLKRNIGIKIGKDKPFLKILSRWTTQLDEEEVLFDISRQHAYRITRKCYDPGFCHYFRHLRLSHLASDGMTSSDLRQITGWTDDKPAKYYVHLNWQDVARRMK